MQNRACLILVKCLTIKIKGERRGGGGSAKTFKTPCPNCVQFDYKYLKQNPGSIYGEHGMRFYSLKNICHATLKPHNNNIVLFVAFVSVQYMQNSA